MSTLTRPAPDIRVARASAWSVVLSNRYVRAMGTHFVVQVLGVLVLLLLAWRNELTLLGQMTAWDGQWYLGIAEYGYAQPGKLSTNPSTPDDPLAFFPLYPLLMRLVALLPGVNLIAAGLIVSTVAGVVASCGIMRLAGHVAPRERVGLLLVALHAAAPLAITMSMVYTEALFIALAVWSLVGVLEHRWLLAGAFCSWAGITRSTATVLIAVVGVAALIAACRSRRERFAALGCAVVAPVGLLTFWGHVARETGSWRGWHAIESQSWGMNFDGGVETAVWFWETLTTDPSVMYVGISGLLVAAVALVVQAARRGVPWPLVAYAAGVIVLVIGTGGLPMTKARLLLPAACVLLLPVALHLAGRSRIGMVVGAAAIMVPGLWFSAYALAIWPYAI